jgi:hypothetical protein
VLRSIGEKFLPRQPVHDLDPAGDAVKRAAQTTIGERFRLRNEHQPPVRVNLRPERVDRRTGLRFGAALDRHRNLEARLPLPVLQQAQREIDLGARHVAAQIPGAGAVGQLLDLDAEVEARGLAGLVAQRDGDAVLAERQRPVRHQREKAAAQRILPIGEARLDVEAAHAVIGVRHRDAIDRDLDGGDAGPRQGPAADFEIAAQRHLHEAADQRRGVEMEPPLAIAGGVAAPDGWRRRGLGRAHREGDLIDLVVGAAQPQPDQMISETRRHAVKLDGTNVIR